MLNSVINKPQQLGVSERQVQREQRAEKISWVPKGSPSVLPGLAPGHQDRGREMQERWRRKWAKQASPIEMAQNLHSRILVSPEAARALPRPK